MTACITGYNSLEDRHVYWIKLLEIGDKMTTNELEKQLLNQAKQEFYSKVNILMRKFGNEIGSLCGEYGVSSQCFKVSDYFGQEWSFTPKDEYKTKVMEDLAKGAAKKFMANLKQFNVHEIKREEIK